MQKAKLNISLILTIIVATVLIAIIAAIFLQSTYFKGNIFYTKLEPIVEPYSPEKATLQFESDFPESTETPDTLYEMPPEGRTGTLELD